jgi:uncharacterized membrane protein
MTLFLIGIIVFFGAHLFTAFFRGAREGLVAAIGEGPYKGLYSLVSVAGFALFVLGWRQADASLLYAPAPALRHVAFALVPLAMILLAAAYLPAGKIAAAVRHPMLAGVKLWAFAHLLANGEVRSVILFGAFLAYGVLDRIAVKRRNAPVREAGPLRNDVIAVVAGLGVSALLVFWLHQYVGGVALVY